jgi:hypothetical protein
MTLLRNTPYIVSLFRILTACVPVLAACLPVDGRPLPGRAIVTVSTDQDLGDGLTTADGWSIRYDRFLLSLGNVWLDRPSKAGRCDEYSPALYVRVIDLREPAQQTLRTLFALGDCAVRFELVSPSGDESSDPTLLVGDVSEEVERFMRSHGSDAFANGGVVLSVAGAASRAGTTLSFDWSFRRSLDYQTCQAVHFEGDTSQTLDIQIQSRFLFHDRIDPETAQVLFDPYAAADAGGDGIITLEELAAVSVDDGSEFTTLAERLYMALVPQMPRVQTSALCFADR